MIRQIKIWFVLLLVCLAFSGPGCTRGEYDGDTDVDTWENPGGDGPEILFLPDHEPPLMPWPNNIATKKDTSTPTGLRINVDTGGETELNKVLRRNLRKLDGFGTSLSITVSFDRDVDISTITNDQIYVFNIQKDNPRFGERHLLDLGYGFYPINLENPESFHPNDKEAENPNILFRKGNRENWYEDETNTLLMRPLTPLAQSSKYVVVLLKGITDYEGEPIRPPEYFEYITQPDMLEETETAVYYLNENHGINVDDVAFVWSFTTQTITKPIENLRNGLNGEGPFSYLSDEFPPRITQIDPLGMDTDMEDDPYLLGGQWWIRIFSVIDPFMAEGSLPLGEMINTQNIDYIVAGTYTTPYFIDQTIPGNEDGYFIWDWQTGDAEYTTEEVTFFISVPKPSAENNYAQPPYPVVFFQHANVRNRLDSLSLANALAIQGFATIGIDAAEHGPETYLWGAYALLKGLEPPPPGIGDAALKTLVKVLIGITYPSWDTEGKTYGELVDMLFAEGTFFGTAIKGRSKDEDGDGVIEGGNSFYSADIFRTKAITLQTLVDLFQGVRVIRNLCNDWDGDGMLSREEGDFNLDGVCDIGGTYDDGEHRPVKFAGMSLGSIIGTSFVAIEKNIHDAVLNVPGGILTDILQRNRIPNVNEAIRNDLMGPLVIGRPVPSGETALTFNRKSVDEQFAFIGTHPGARVVYSNLDSRETRSKRIGDDGNFSVSVAADEGDWMMLQVVNDDGDILEELTWASEYRGLGVERNTPIARAFVESAQWGIDGVDPINFAPYWRLHPLPGYEKKNVLIQMCMPDNAVPTSAGLALARAAGYIDIERQIKLKEHGVFDFGYTLAAEANLPLQSISHGGWRLHPGAHHEYMLAPRPYPNAVMYSFFAKNQAGIFLGTDGEWIEDNPNALVPPEYFVPGF